MTYVIVTTGSQNGRLLKTTEVLQIQEGSTFQPGPTMVTGVNVAQLVPAHPKQESTSCYLIGGYGGGTSGEKYSLNKKMDSWTHIGDMKQPRYGFAAVTLPGGFIPGCGSAGM